MGGLCRRICEVRVEGVSSFTFCECTNRFQCNASLFRVLAIVKEAEEVRQRVHWYEVRREANDAR